MTHKRIVKTAGLTCLALAGFIIGCGGIIDEKHPLDGVFYLESMTVKFALNNMIRVESPVIVGDLTVSDTSYNMFYGLADATGDSLVDDTFADRHYSGRYEIYSSSDSVRLHNMPKVKPYTTDWWYHRTTTTLTLDNANQTQVWTYRFPAPK